MQCSEPACVDACPTKAAYINEDGVVLVDEDRCFGCQYCIWACPYEARFLHPTKRVVEKCTMCLHLITRGEKPNCVVNCIAKARVFGDLDDPESEASKVLAQNTDRAFKIREDLETEPNVYYLKAKGVKLK
jgi:Fe-S-cluster-containing dehydrogenase component